MLDKLSEIVLHKLIELCNGKPETDLKFNVSDFGNSLNNDVLTMLLKDLEKNEYLEYSCPPGYGTPFSAKLTYKGYAYFERKQAENKFFFKRSVVLPIMITIVTQLLLWGANELRNAVLNSSEERTADYTCHYHDNYQ